MRRLIALFALVSVILAIAALSGCARRLPMDPESVLASEYFFPGPEPEVPKSLPVGAKKLLDRNGFVVLGRTEAWNLTAAYFAASPNFITADSVLYVFHCLFRGGLSEYEKTKLIPVLGKLCDQCLSSARSMERGHAKDPLLAEPARRNVVFFSVAKAALSGAAPADAGREVRELVAKINAAEEPGFYPNEDFTIYKPRGVYAEDEQLARYFRATKWLSRGILPIIPGSMDDPAEAEIKLRQAYLLGTMLREPAVGKTWSALDNDIRFFLGESDSFTPVQFLDAIADIPIPTDDKWVAAVRREFSKSEYPRSKIESIPQGNPGDAPDKYVQFMGERYVPDGHIHQETVYPYARRTIPKGLDIGYALLGSGRAKVHLAEDLKQDPELGKQLDRFSRLFRTYGTEDEPSSIYSGWVGAVREVLNPPKSPHVPEFIHTDAWQDKSLNTALASWAQLRHDFILYAKQPITPACGGSAWFVEPVPKLYIRLGQLAKQLDQRGFTGMEDFGNLCCALEVAARMELEGKVWSESTELHDEWAKCPGSDEWEFYIGSFGQWLLKHFSTHVPVERPCVVADVHTDSNPPNRVLHEATGPFNLIVIPGQFGRDTMGWVFSYYEFTEDNFKRLTDAEWEKRVLKGRHRKARPEWTRSYLYGG